MRSPVTSTPTQSPRSLHLCDVENQTGLARPLIDHLEAARDGHLSAVPVACGDHVVVGCDRGSGYAAKSVWGRSTRLVVGEGPDGADRALLEAVQLDHAAKRYDRLVIGSGDGRAFTPLAVRAAALGMEVVVVTLASSCAWSLAKAAHQVIWLPVWPWTDPSALTTTAA